MTFNDTHLPSSMKKEHRLNWVSSYMGTNHISCTILEALFWKGWDINPCHPYFPLVRTYRITVKSQIRSRLEICKPCKLGFKASHLSLLDSGCYSIHNDITHSWNYVIWFMRPLFVPPSRTRTPLLSRQ